MLKQSSTSPATGDAVLPVIVNNSGGAVAAGSGDQREQIEQAFSSQGVKVVVDLVEGAEIAEWMARAAGAPRIVLGGGDGTMSTAAAALAGTTTSLAILPLGTLNHLARDLGIPATLEEAARIAVNGHPVAIDLGRLNEAYFVNNVSIGIYPAFVRLREEFRTRTGLPKWLVAGPAAWIVLIRLKKHRLRLDTAAGSREIITPLLFIGNNRYSLDAGEVGMRRSLCEGKLSVLAVQRHGRLSLLWFGLRAILGRANKMSDFVMLDEVTELTVTAERPGVDVGIDGELKRLDYPLVFTSEPAALTVICPEDNIR